MEDLSGFVYSISHKEFCYVGSTRQKEKERWLRHVNEYKREKPTTYSKIVFKKAEIDGVLPTYIVLENYADISDLDLAIREQSYLDEFDCVNKYRAYTSDEQKRENYRNYHKNYQYQNYEKIKEQRRKRYGEKKIKANTIDAQAT